MSVTLGTQQPPFVPSVYFTSGYGTATAAAEGAQWGVVSDEAGAIQMPLVLRDIDGDVRDAVSPYGYSGIYVNKQVDAGTLRHVWDDVLGVLNDHDVVSVFFRFCPFIKDQTSRLDGVPGLAIRSVSETILVPVSHDVDLMWSAMQGRARTAIRKARNSGFESHVEQPSASLSDSDHPFRQLYSGTMERLQAAGSYHFPDEYFATLVESQAARLQLATVTDSEGSAVAAALMLVDDNTVHYHLSGSDQAAARLGANNLLIWQIMEWSAEAGKSAVHLGGGTTAGDSLFKFKSSFGGEVATFQVGRLVVNEARYAELVRQRARQLGVSHQELAQSNFFPAYRAGGAP